MTHPRNRQGFALPMAIFLLLVTTGAVMTSLAETSTERRVSDSAASGERALVLAESGLARLDELGFDFASSVEDSARLTMTGGFVDVVMERLRAPTSTERAVFVVRARGVHTQGGWSDAPDAMRTVVRLGEWVEGTMQVHAGWTSLTGLRKNGAAGSLSGVDACGVESSVAGVAVPGSPGYSGHTGPVNGSPPIENLGATPEDAADEVHIHWAGIVDGSALEPDYVYPGDGWPSDFNDWPVVYVDNPGAGFSLPTAGRGTLIVRGDLTISGSRSWDGIVLVGGELTSNGNNKVRGATITGLNVKLGESPGESDVGNGNKSYVYDSCNVQDAMQSQASFRMLDNTWLDTWAQY